MNRLRLLRQVSAAARATQAEDKGDRREVPVQSEGTGILRGSIPAQCPVAE